MPHVTGTWWELHNTGQSGKISGLCKALHSRGHEAWFHYICTSAVYHQTMRDVQWWLQQADNKSLLQASNARVNSEVAKVNRLVCVLLLYMIWMHTHAYVFMWVCVCMRADMGRPHLFRVDNTHIQLCVCACACDNPHTRHHKTMRGMHMLPWQQQPTNLCAFKGKGGQIVWVLLVPREAQQWQLLRVLVQNGGMFQIPGHGPRRCMLSRQLVKNDKKYQQWLCQNCTNIRCAIEGCNWIDIEWPNGELTL